MRLCVLTDRYPPNHSGGAGIIAANLAERYVERGHDVTVVTGVENEADAGQQVRNGVTVRAFTIPTIGPLRAYYSIYHPVAVRKIKPVFDNCNFDAVHAHNLHELISYHMLKLAKQQSIPVVLTYHDAMSVEYGKLIPNRNPAIRDSKSAYRVSPWSQFKKRKVFYFPLRNWLNRRYLNTYVDLGISVSEALRTALSTNGIQTKQVIHNGIDVDPYDDADSTLFEHKFELADEQVILYSGRVSYYKGGEHLARAFKRTAEKFENIRLVVTGSRTEFVQRMQELAGRHGDKILSTGWLDETTLRSAYKAATVVVSPSIYLDPFPTVNLEAMAAGTAVISSCYGGSKELVIDEKTGLIIDPCDISEFADALANLISNPKRCRQYGVNGRQRVESRFTLAKQVDAYLDVIKDVPNLR